jgi:hypothetical protein
MSDLLREKTLAYLRDRYPALALVDSPPAASLLAVSGGTEAMRSDALSELVGFSAGWLARELEDSPPLPPFGVQIIRAFQPGDVVILRSTHPISEAEGERIRNAIRGMGDQLPQVRFVLIDDTLEVVGREEPVKPEVGAGG